MVDIMKKILILFVAIVLFVCSAASVSAASIDKWVAGEGYTINGKLNPTTIKETDKGINITCGGQYTNGNSYGGAAYTEKIDIDDVTVEVYMDRLEATNTDAWFGVEFLSKPDIFKTGNMASNPGVVYLLEFHPDTMAVWSSAPTAFSIINRVKDEKFKISTGSTLTVSLSRNNEGNHDLYINGIKCMTYDNLEEVFPEGEAYIVVSSSIAQSEPDQMSYTITKINGESVVEAKDDTADENPDSSDEAIGAAILTAVSGAGIFYASKKKKTI